MQQREINIDSPDLYSAIAEIDPIFLQEKSHQQIITDGLEAYRKINGCNYAALYVINQENFDFLYEVSTEGVDKEEVENSFKFLVDKGSIANALSTGEITFGETKYEAHNDNFMIIPLIVQSGVTGLIILSLNESFTRQENIINLCRIYSNYYALLMQNHFLIEEIQDIKLLSEQKISIRTNKIVNSTRELKSILDTVHAGIIIIDKNNMQIADANVAALQLAGVLKEDILGTSSDSLFISKGRTTKSKAAASKLEELLIKSDGTLIPVIKTVSDINLGGEQFIIETFIDITDRKKMEEALREAHAKLEQRVEERTIQLSMANQELKKEINERIKIEKELLAAKEKVEQSDKLKSNILANMQHEFRTPLISIQGFSKILSEDATSNNEHREISKYIYSSGKRLLNTLNSILIMSNFESNNVSVRLTRYNLSEEIGSIVLPFEAAAIEKNLKFKLNPGENIYVTIDHDLFSQAISNLLDNAIKFTKKGCISVTCELVSAGGKNRAAIMVQDTGIGIKDSDQKIIFEPLRQASEGYARNYEGSGLGLTLSQKMIELMNGKITLESEFNSGSIFTVWLPA